MQKACNAAALLAIAVVLAGCSSAAPDLDSTDPGTDQASTDPATDQVTTVTSGTVLPEGKPYDIEGRVGVAGGCVVIIDSETETSRLAVWPVGTQLADTQLNVVRLANGEVNIGESIEPSRGYIMPSDELEALLLVEGNSISGWKECESAGDEVVVLSYVKDFAQQE